MVDENEDTEIELSEEEEKKIIELFKKNSSSFAYEEMNEKLNQIETLMNEVEQISERIGIPFSASVSPLSNTYVPTSMYAMYGKLGEGLNDLLDDVGVYVDSESYKYGGWEHSAVC